MSQANEGWTPKPPLGYTLAEWELILERDVLAGWPPPFEERWVIYCDIDGFKKIVLDPEKRERVAHLYWDIANSLSWGVRHHRALAVADAVYRSRNPGSADAVRERQKAALELWRKRVRIFSDSIFVFLNPRTELPAVEAPEHTLDGRFVADVAASLSRVLWQAGLPHRGGVAFGKCFLDEGNSVFLGEPIVRAYETALQQEWLGYAVHPGSWVEAKRQLGDQPFLFTGRLPVRDGKDAPVRWNEGRCVLPFPSALMEMREGAEVNRDRVVQGLLEALATVEKSNPRVFGRYARTARVWLRDAKDVGEDDSAAELKALAEETVDVEEAES